MAQGYGPDLRILIGWLFAIFGGILTVFGLFRQDAFAPLTRSNVNLQWGIVLLVFGAVMLALGYRREAASKRGEARQTPTIR